MNRQTKLFTLLLLPLFLAMSCSGSSSNGRNAIDKNELSSLLKENPDILIEALKLKPSELLDIVQKGVEAKREEVFNREIKSSMANPLVPVIESDRIIRGNPNAPITIAEYSDFQCPYCAKGAKLLDSIMAKYGDKVRVVYKHNPLTGIHKHAYSAALYFEAIALQNSKKAWEFHDAIFADQSILNGGDSGLVSLAEKIGVDTVRLQSDVKSVAVKKRVGDDIKEARRFGFNGTPSFLINGVPIRGMLPKEKFFKVIDLIASK